MSQHRPFDPFHSVHPIPRGGVDPLRSAEDALAVLALGAPYGHDTIVILLDDRRCGSSITVVTDTVDADAMFDVLEVCLEVAHRVPDTGSLVLASSRPGGGVVDADVHRWLEASDQCAAAGIELVEWFVIGRWGTDCPRERFGAPERWSS